ncbi:MULTISPECIES: TetR/AcrR family transcriptional regulator [unclassified Streptomyces]|uniref:TetR/AcrR family transcriptional regulator n=1 Tax=unclassified Streptomyces TaxID=2593676 RepID=UPI002DD92BD3|nr:MULTISPECIES: TetR/AcrR family transcriptional regulator [unclassified Streptomyces]WSA90954.1 TetR/AcrR family transcriptional regulator [Streptomyces sp. NBC_01795]WSB75279.1 TetR/AcrR family transcriptional regulator [Streptomyces sp. NBC_01775]WSS16438.1 TetR/AcrR family transcriptional regulator [Streptomyces sp. NBC_01186]WSS45256.1 TetR/AcrR family transcriptional regulator [Streptomyces sp. NBC_01187]
MAETRRGRPSTGVREAVLKATEEVLGEAGLALSTKEIARRAGVAESSVFYHFGDRLGLLQAVIGLHLPVFSDATAVLGDRTPSGDPADDLTALVAGLERFYLGILPILGALQSDSQLRDLLAERDGEIGPHLALGPVTDWLRTERAAGRMPEAADPRAGALLLIGAAHQRALHTYLLGPAAARFLPPVEAVVRTLLPAFVGGASGT